MHSYRGETKASNQTITLLRVVYAATLGLLVLWIFWPASPEPHSSPPPPNEKPRVLSVVHNVAYNVDTIDPPQKTFYDDPTLSFLIENPIKNWDEKRQEWLKNHPSQVVGARERVLIVTGSQSSPCKNPIGDHLLLRLFKNKVDYGRINGYKIFYNNAHLNPKMWAQWGKIPVIKAAMIAHPETEWIYWVDSDAVFTDMDYKPPMKRYKDYNLVVGGMPHLVYDHPSWLGLNNGVILIRNCQWSMEFLEEWAKFGPQTPDHAKWVKIITSTIRDKKGDTIGDQPPMVYLLHTNKNFRDKVFLEHEHCIQGYWETRVKTFDDVSKNYAELEKTERKLRRRRAEKENKAYSQLWELYLESAGYKKDAGKRPCITHFTGCAPCSGEHNLMYNSDTCRKEMERSLNFADNQVLRNYGYVHPNLYDSYTVAALPFTT